MLSCCGGSPRRLRCQAETMANMGNVADPDSLAARYLSTFFLGEFIGLIAFSTENLKIDGTDLQILACLVHFSSWQAINEGIDNGTISTENFDPEQIAHKPVNAKSIYLTLGMSRETVRRRLIDLESRGVFQKVEGGYIFPVQRGDADFSRDIRIHMLGMAKRMQQRLKNIMPDEA
jgi:hypothetical protein